MENNNNNENKDKKTRRKSVSEFFSHLNTTNDSNNKPGEVVTNPKSKIVKWVFGGLVLTTSVLGISIPWSLSSCSIIAKKPIGNHEKMYSVMLNGIEHSVWWKDFKDRVNSYQSSDSQEITDLTTSFNYSVLKKLYNEERDAYLKFAAIINQKYSDQGKSDRVGATTFGFDVSKSFDDIRNVQKKELNKAKINFQKNVGSDWLNKWASELATNPIYGMQNLENATTKSLSYLESKAIDYMTTVAIKEPALARFKSAEINTTQWTASDLAWTPSKEITYIDVNNQSQTVTVDQAKQFISSFLKINENAMNWSNPSIENRNKLVVFQTKSYIPQYRVPNALLSEVLPNFYNSAVISSFDLAIKPGTNNFSAFTFDNSVITNLFKITTNPISSLVTPNGFAAITQISNFKGALSSWTSTDNGSSQQQTTLNDKQIANDAQLIINLSGSDEESDASKTVGSSKLKILGDFFTSSSDNSGSSSTKDSSSSSDSNSSTDATKNAANLVALTSDGSSYITSPPAPNPNPTVDDFQLFKARKQNPITTFLNLLFSIDTSTGRPVFATEKTNQPQTAITAPKYLEKYYNAILASTAPTQTALLIELIKNNFEWNSTTKSISVQNKIDGDYNSKLENIVKGFGTDDATYIGKLFAISFIDATTAKVNYLEEFNSPTTPIYQKTVGYWSLYELSNGTYLHINADGMKIFTRETLTSLNAKTKLDQMIKSDLSRTATDNAKPLMYDVASIYSKINDDNIINFSLLSDKKNKSLFTYKIYEETFNNKFANDSTKKPQPYDENETFLTKETNLTPKEISDIKNKVNMFIAFTNANVASLISTNDVNGIKNVGSIIDTMLNSKKYYDFATIKDTASGELQTYWQYDQLWNNTPTNTISDQKYLGLMNIRNLILNRTQNIIKPVKKAVTK